VIRRIRDYVTLVAMTNSRIAHVRDMSREVVRRDGWRVRPCSGKRWRESFVTIFDGLRLGEITLWYNDLTGSTHIVRWCDAIGIIVGDGSQQARDTAKAIRRMK